MYLINKDETEHTGQVRGANEERVGDMAQATPAGCCLVTP
jgi:hypothetical protein